MYIISEIKIKRGNDMKERKNMAKKSKIEFERGRIYYIIDYILREYDKNFCKEFVTNEFKDREALFEVLEELNECKKGESKKHKINSKKNTKFVLSNAEIRYMRNIYNDYNQYEINTRYSIFNTALSIFALLVSILLSLISNIENILFISVLMAILGIILNKLIHNLF